VRQSTQARSRTGADGRHGPVAKLDVLSEPGDLLRLRVVSDATLVGSVSGGGRPLAGPSALDGATASHSRGADSVVMQMG